MSKEIQTLFNRKYNLPLRNRYNLGEIGREKINKKIYKRILYGNEITLKPEDILGALNYMLKINKD